MIETLLPEVTALLRVTRHWCWKRRQALRRDSCRRALLALDSKDALLLEPRRLAARFIARQLGERSAKPWAIKYASKRWPEPGRALVVL